MKATERLWLVARGGVFSGVALTALFTIITCGARAPAAPLSLSAPVFSMPGGYYDHSITVEMRVAASDARIIYTLDGSEPTATNGITYTQPLRVSGISAQVVVVRARAIRGVELGPITTASYIVDISTNLPIVSLIVDPADLWRLDTGIYSNPKPRGKEAERGAHITYVAADRASGFATPVGVRIHGGASRYRPKKSLRLYFRGEYGASKLDYPLFGPTAPPTFKRLVLHAGGEDNMNSIHWTLLRNQLFYEIALQLDRATVHSEYVLLFLNGQLWGIYDLRERIDQFFLRDYYGIEDADMVMQIRYTNLGTMEHWNALFDFVTTHDLRDAENYAHAVQHIDVDNFIDYNLLQFYVINTDWPPHNVEQARARVPSSKWIWFLWDVDHGMNLRANVSVEDHNFVSSRTFAGGSGKFTDFLSRFLENPEFRNRFLTRAADLLNTVLAPNNTVAAVDAQAALIEPNIYYELVRWLAPDCTDWYDNVALLRDFVRQRAPYVRADLVAAANLAGTATITFTNATPERGYLVVNGFPITAPEWQGTYFRGTAIQVTAVPTRGYVFAGWHDTQYLTATATISVTADYTLAPRFVPAPPAAPQPYDVIITEWGANDRGQCYNTIAGRCIEGDWVELLVTRAEGVDLRGWRITDNDMKIATDEGSLIFAHGDSLAQVPRGTTILVICTPTPANTRHFLDDDLDYRDGQMVLYVGNDTLDSNTDPRFGLRAAGDNIALLAPTYTGIDFVAWGRSAVTPATFGILRDGVHLEPPVVVWGSDSEAFFTAARREGYAARFIAAPPPDIPTPGRANYQRSITASSTEIWLGWGSPAVLLVLIAGLVHFALPHLEELF